MQHDVVKEVDGDKYQIFHMAPSKAWKVLVRLTKLVAPALKNDQGPQKEFSMDSFLDMDPMVVVAEIAERLEEESSLETVHELLECGFLMSSKGGKSTGAPLNDIFEVHFNGRTLTLIKVLGEILRHNYASFFKDASAKTAAPGKTEAKSSTPVTLT